MRQDKERSIREQADLWKGYWCILACILLVGTERRFFSTDPAGESNGRDTD